MNHARRKDVHRMLGVDPPGTLTWEANGVELPNGLGFRGGVSSGKDKGRYTRWAAEL